MEWSNHDSILQNLKDKKTRALSKKKTAPKQAGVIQAAGEDDDNNDETTSAALFAVATPIKRTQ